jgi:cell division protein ZapE
LIGRSRETPTPADPGTAPGRGTHASCGSPLACYRQDLERGTLSPDPAQAAVVERLQALHEALTSGTRPSLLTRLRARLRGRTPAPVPGIYLWGGVGRGKTFLVDRFQACLPPGESERVHFHRFMQGVHGELRALRDHRDPLAIIGRRMAERVGVLCLDEFHVADIADAMILAGLLRAMFDHGLTLVATSNSAPEDLYRGGLQRDRFAPAIELIQTRMEVVRLDAGVDYRLRALDRDSVYRTPADEAAEAALAAFFDSLSGGMPARHGELEVNDRPIETLGLADGVAWFGFRALCETPRSQADYIELARCFHSILVSNIPLLDRERDDAARRFVHLIDELYDRRVNLIASAEAPPERLYSGTRLASSFQRTASRLLEMQSHEYLAMEHRP